MMKRVDRSVLSSEEAMCEGGEMISIAWRSRLIFELDFMVQNQITATSWIEVL
jgi:hypothetical protein